MRRIVLDRVVEPDQEIVIKGPPLEALCFQGVRPGSLVTLTDCRQKDFRGRVLRLSEEEASVVIFGAFSLPMESSLEILLLQALPDRERMELIIQKATELGAAAIVPFKSEKSISLEERESKQRKAHRWQDIAIKALRQSRRARVPEVKTYRSFEEALDFCDGEGLKIVLWEKRGLSLRETLRNHRPQRVYVMVGPEGGLTETEVRLAEEKGFIPVKLGQRILRTETASITIVGILQYELGDLG